MTVAVLKPQPLRATAETLESEQAVAGAMLIDPRCIADVLDVVDDRDFGDRRVSLVVGAVRDLSEAKQQVDVVGVERMLQPRREAFGEDVDAVFRFVASLAEGVVTASGVKHHAAMVREASRARRLVDAARRVLDLMARAGVDDVAAATEQAVDLVVKAAARDADRTTTTDMKAAGKAACDDIREHYEASKAGRPSNALLPTGLAPLDELVGGYPFGQLSIVAGRPAMGKSILGQMVAVSTARSGFGAIYVSAEMPTSTLAKRQLAVSASVEVGRVLTGDLDDGSVVRLVTGSADLAGFGARLMVDDKSGPTLGHVERLVRRFGREQPETRLKCVVVDYLQLMRGADTRLRSDLQIGSYSQGLLDMAKDHGIAIVALSQLSRDCERRPNKRPMLSDLRESGQLEQDANRVLGIYRDEVYNEESPEKGVAEILVLKNREGRTGTVKVGFQGQFQRFVPLASGSRYEQPGRRPSDGRDWRSGD